jgi:hypothetical protein
MNIEQGIENEDCHNLVFNFECLVLSWSPLKTCEDDNIREFFPVSQGDLAKVSPWQTESFFLTNL